MSFENMNFEEQYKRMEMDMAWDEYIETCRMMGAPIMPFALWKLDYLQCKEYHF